MGISTRSVLSGMCWYIKPSFTSELSVPERLLEGLLENTEGTASCKTGCSSKNINKELSNNAALKTRP